MKYVLISFLCFSLAGYASEPIMLSTTTGKLYGELIVAAENPTGAVVLIVAGSGPTDRDGNSAMIAGKSNSYKMIAEGLAEKGISSLRYDKRGIGLSKSALEKEEDLTFEVLVNDALEWIKLLKSDTRFQQFYILGHSQGALVATVAASKDSLNGVISLSGTSLSADEIMESQLKGLPEGLDVEAKQILQNLREGKTTKDVTMFLVNVFRPSVQPFIMSWMNYTPKEYAKNISIPLLVLHGETDIQLPDWHADSLAAQNSTYAKLFKVSGMNHVLKDAPMRRTENMATYGNPDLKLSAGLVDVMVSFIKSTMYKK
jgi:pimeloyl-ACP methyl ester carboxylesterase